METSQVPIQPNLNEEEWFSIETEGGHSWLLPLESAAVLSTVERDASVLSIVEREAEEPAWLRTAASVLLDESPPLQSLSSPLPYSATRRTIACRQAARQAVARADAALRGITRRELLMSLLIGIFGCLLVESRPFGLPHFASPTAGRRSAAACEANLVALEIETAATSSQLRATLMATAQDEAERRQELDAERKHVALARLNLSVSRAQSEIALSEVQAELDEAHTRLRQREEEVSSLKAALAQARRGESDSDQARRIEREGWRWRVVHEQREKLQEQEKALSAQRKESRASADKVRMQKSTIADLKEQIRSLKAHRGATRSKHKVRGDDETPFEEMSRAQARAKSHARSQAAHAKSQTQSKETSKQGEGKRRYRETAERPQHHSCPSASWLSSLMEDAGKGWF